VSEPSETNPKTSSEAQRRARQTERRLKREARARRQIVVYALGVVALAAAYWNAQTFGERRLEDLAPREAALREAAKDMFARPRDEDREELAALSEDDQAELETQREIVRTLARRELGVPPKGGALEDLRILQQLVDARVLAPENEYELQALGVVLGDVMAKQLGLAWTIFEDERGRSRALRIPKTDDYFFPVTMISRRYSAHFRPGGDALERSNVRYGEVDVEALYRDIEAQVARLRAGSS